MTKIYIAYHWLKNTVLKIKIHEIQNKNFVSAYLNVNNKNSTLL